MDPDHGLALVAGSLQGNVALLSLSADRQGHAAANRAGLDQTCRAPVAGDRRAVDRPDDISSLEPPGGGQAPDRTRDGVVRRERDAELAQRCGLRGLLRAGHLLSVLLRDLPLGLPRREELLLWHDGLVRAEPCLERVDDREGRARPWPADVG